MWLCVSAVLLCYPRCDYENLLLSKRLLGDVCSDVLIIDEGLIYDSVLIVGSSMSVVRMARITKKIRACPMRDCVNSAQTQETTGTKS